MGDGAPAVCPDDTMVSALRKVFGIMRRSEYLIDGMSIVKHISWFSKDGDGSTYNLALVDPNSGALRPLGEAYVQECGGTSPEPGPTPAPTPSPPSPTPVPTPSDGWVPC